MALKLKPCRCFIFVRWEAIKPNLSVQPPTVSKYVHLPFSMHSLPHSSVSFCFRYKDLIKLHKEAEDRLKAVDDVGVRVARAALDTLIVSCERWSARLQDRAALL